MYTGAGLRKRWGRSIHINSQGTVRIERLEADLVVMGGGGAGLAAALAAAEKGASVIVLEKRGAPGGNSTLAWGLFAAESPTQKRKAINVRRDDCFKTAMDWAHWKINPRIVRAFIDRSGDTIRWLEEKGISFTCGSQNQPGRGGIHLPEGRGAALIKVLAKECKGLGVQLLTRAQAKNILTGKKGTVTGVVAKVKGQEFTITTRSVIIATGGYGGNQRLLKKYCPDYRDNMTCFGIPNIGDGLIMATEIGGATDGLGILHLAGPALPRSVCLTIGTKPNVIRIQLTSITLEPNTIWVNKRGKRFVDEAIGFNHFESPNAVLQQPGNVCYTLFDSKITQSMTEQGLILGMGLPTGVQGNRLTGLERELQIQAEKGWAKIADSWDEIADWIGADPEVLQATIDEYNTACDRGYDPIFNKERIYLLSLRTPPYYAVKGRADFLGTIGGIKINEYMEVIDKQENPIPGLYAAGIDTGGWEPESYCALLAGSTFGFAINSGRIAGENAAKFALKTTS